MSRHTGLVVSLAVFTVGFLAAGIELGRGEVSTPPTIINMENWMPYYSPREATIHSLSPVRWVNPTASPHTVRHDGCAHEGPCLFKSGPVHPEGSFTIEGLAPGRYPYHCELHPIMRGELIVGGQTPDSAQESNLVAQGP